MVITDECGSIVYANVQTERLFGYRPDELKGNPIEMLLPERFRKSHPALRASYARAPRLRPMGENLRLFAQHRDGNEIRVEVRLSSLKTEEGLLVLSAIRDISARVDLPLKANLMVPSRTFAAQQPGDTHGLIEDRHVGAEGTLNCIGDAVISTDLAGKVTYFNPGAERITGWLRSEATGRVLREVLTLRNDTDSQPTHTLQSVSIDATLPCAWASGLLTRRDGTEFAVEHSAAPIQDDQGEVTGTVMVFRDVSAARAITQKLAYAAHHDSLTGLPNRLLLESRLTQAMALARRHNSEVAVLFLDLDRFKSVNDTWGHIVGDRLLESVARVLRSCVRSTDIVSRLGGDEFVVLLSEISDPENAIASARKILEALQNPHSIDQHRLLATVSVGIGVCPYDGIDPQTLLCNADAAMFQAKRSVGNTYRISHLSAEHFAIGPLDTQRP
jgi:diguanylate cyclase (GGDEF)-like protein/PAS domain S-box-containing protein